MKKDKTTCIFFKSLYDAARELHETSPEDAYEVYNAFFAYAFGETEGIETESQVARLLVMQNVESLNAAENRYKAAVENGKKGKEFGKLGGRPRKGETKEQARERRETPEKPQNKPQNLDVEKTPEKPLTVSVSDSVSNTVSYSNTNTVTITESNLKEKETYKEKEMEKPTQELDRGGSPSSRLSVFDLEKADQFPYMERRLEHQYCDILKHLPEYERMHPGTGVVGDTEARYSSDTSDFLDRFDGTTMSNMMLMWFDGGRERMAELVQGLDPKTTKEILTYLVLYCKTSDKVNEAARLEPVYSI